MKNGLINNNKDDYNKNKSISNNMARYGFFSPIFNDVFKFPTLKDDFKEFDKIMNTDIYEDKNNYILEVDVPGFDREEINIDFNNGYLTVSAIKKENNEENHNYIRREKFYGNYSRSFYIGDINEENIDARLEKGVLSVKIKKDNNNQIKKKIEIK